MQNYLIVKKLIDLSQSNKLPMVWLRPRKLDPQLVFEDDFDFLVYMNEFAKILSLIFDLCRDNQISFTVKQQSPFKIKIALLSDNKNKIILEFWSVLKFQTCFKPGLLSTAAIDYLSYKRVAARHRNTLDAVLFILHLHYKVKKIQVETQQWRIKYYLNLNIDPSIRKILLMVQDEDKCIELVHNACLRYLYDLNIPIVKTLKLTLIKISYFFKSALRLPTFRTIAVIGPDGSGKSSLIQHLTGTDSIAKYKVCQFKRLFRRPLFHIYTKEPRNIRDEKMISLILPVALICFIICLICRNWRRILILDRYFYDYLAIDIRSADKPLKPIKNCGLWSKLLPAPNRLVIAMCPVDIILTRKNELSALNINLLYKFYLQLILKNNINNILFCNTNADLNNSLGDLRVYLRANGQ